MNKSKFLKIMSLVTIMLLLLTTANIKISKAAESADYKVNLSDLTLTSGETTTELKKYTQNDFEAFLSDYNSGNLPAMYVTEFLFDGVSMVKTYDLDDFVESGNDVEVKTLKITAINVNTTGNVEFTGEITGGMIAVDTNGRSGEVNLILNNAKIDTDSKKTPAILVYNKDITYTGYKVTIKTTAGSKNYLEGGKFKKVSLVGSDELSNYTSKYSGDTQTNYTKFTNYYGVYTSAQINNILFAKVQADSDDLKDGDPYYFYKAAGAISSDIDLYFEGNGYLEVKSKNKEGIETKGNLTFAGGTGDYAIYAEDDCLNTTTSSSSNKSARNTLTIDVNSLYAIVDSGEDADEGDAIDSNGTLVINGGTIVAVAHPGQDAGIDSENGIYINGGTVLATGDMLDAISNESKQNYMVLSFQNKVEANTLVTLLNQNEDTVMAYKTDRAYTNLIYSSADLKEGSYSLYKGGEIEGTEANGYYTQVSKYTKGTQQGYSSTGNQGGMGNGERPNGQAPDRNMSENETSNGENSEDMSNANMKNGERPELPSGEMPEAPSGERPELPNGENPESSNENGNINNSEDMKQPVDMQQNTNTTATATNKEFKVSGISNQFSGIADYSESGTTEISNETTTNSTENQLKNLLSNKVVLWVSVGVLAIAMIVIIAVIVTKRNKKIKKQQMKNKIK